MKDNKQVLTAEEQKMFEEFMEKVGSDDWAKDLLTKDGAKYIPILEKILGHSIKQ